MGQSPAPREHVHEFSKYRLREPLSDSFLGTRYRAVSNVSGNMQAASNAFGTDMNSWRSSAFALRLLRAETTTLIDRVARAAKAVRYLDHPNVLAPIQLIRAQTKLGVITQDVDGATLTRVMRLASTRGEGLPQTIALRIALDVLDGVNALHSAEGKVARYAFACGGLTPDSIHIGSDGRTRLLDPGVAGAAASVPHWGHDPVALAYTAPEQTGAEPNFTPCSDAFAIGVMLWEMLAGQSLFGAGTAAETLERLHRGEIPRVQRDQFMRGEPISALVALAVTRALSREPKQRYQNCEALASELTGADESATHEAVVEYCRSLPSNSAGAFSSRPPAADTGFEAITGPISRIEALQVASLQHQSRVAADAFEPRTERMSSPFLGPPVKEDACPTAFPISDFVPAKQAAKRSYLPLAAAAIVLLGAGWFAWQRGPLAPSPRPASISVSTDTTRVLAERSPTNPSERAAAKSDPRAAARPASAETTHSAATTTLANSSTAAPRTSPTATSNGRGPDLQPSAPSSVQDASSEKSAADAAARREARRARRRAAAAARVTDQKPMPEPHEPTGAGPFIPDDI
jgi:serine/threonine protein kinase